MLEFELVLPAYNEAKSLPDLYKKVAEAALSCGFTPDRCQVVLVDNGSTDDSAVVLKQLQSTALGAWFRVVTVALNQGYGFGVKAGLDATTAPFIGWSHADLQCDPVEAFRAAVLLQNLSASTPLVIKGKRFGRSLSSRIISSVFAFAAGVSLGLWCGEINAQPKVFPRRLLGHLSGAPVDFSFDLFALYRAKAAGFSLRTIPVYFPNRRHGVSNWSASFKSRRRTIVGMLRYCRHLALTEGRL
ncbi:MAG: glycosyltransferase [Proteobacteria bacterium]|nr:glycosyltransferase [Pseudomonadota bacterium]